MGNCIGTKRKDLGQKIAPLERMHSTQTAKTDTGVEENKFPSALHKTGARVNNEIEQRPYESCKITKIGSSMSRLYPRPPFEGSRQLFNHEHDPSGMGSDAASPKNMTRRNQQNSKISKNLSIKEKTRSPSDGPLEVQQNTINRPYENQLVRHNQDRNRHKDQAIQIQSRRSESNGTYINPEVSSLHQQPLLRKGTGQTATTAVPVGHSMQLITQEKLPDSVLSKWSSNESESMYIDTSRLISILEKGEGHQVSLGFSVLDQNAHGHF